MVCLHRRLIKSLNHPSVKNKNYELQLLISQPQPRNVCMICGPFSAINMSKFLQQRQKQ